MSKFNKENYNFIDLSETDHTQFSQIELDKLVDDTKEILAMTKSKIKNTPMNLALVGGILAVRGGQFKSINALTGAKWKKGNATKEESKLFKKVFSTARLYYVGKMVLAFIKKEGERDMLNPTLAQKK